MTPFYFGCEADDPSNVWAFSARANPLGARLNAIFSSDIGHFDVPDMTEVVPEAYEMVEDGLANSRLVPLAGGRVSFPLEGLSPPRQAKGDDPWRRRVHPPLTASRYA